MQHWTQVSLVRLRATLLWLAVTATATALGRLAAGDGPGLLRSPSDDFTGLLVQGCGTVALVAGGWLWLLTTGVAVVAWRSPGRPVTGRVGPARRALLAACGVAVLATTAPAGAARPAPDHPGTPALPARVLDGLPLPDRPAGAVPGHPRVVQVRPGDSLWAIAARQLGPAASAADLASYWRRIHRLNAVLIGPDPDLVQPGQELRLPPVRPPHP